MRLLCNSPTAFRHFNACLLERKAESAEKRTNNTPFPFRNHVMVTVFTFKCFLLKPSLATNYPPAVTAPRIIKRKNVLQDDTGQQATHNCLTIPSTSTVLVKIRVNMKAWCLLYSQAYTVSWCHYATPTLHTFCLLVCQSPCQGPIDSNSIGKKQWEPGCLFSPFFLVHQLIQLWFAVFKLSNTSKAPVQLPLRKLHHPSTSSSSFSLLWGCTVINNRLYLKSISKNKSGIIFSSMQTGKRPWSHKILRRKPPSLLFLLLLSSPSLYVNSSPWDDRAIPLGFHVIIQVTPNHIVLVMGWAKLENGSPSSKVVIPLLFLQLIELPPLCFI